MALAVGRGKLTDSNTPKGEITCEHNSETFTAAGGRAFLSTQGPTSLDKLQGKLLGNATTREATRQQKKTYATQEILVKVATHRNTAVLRFYQKITE